MATKYRIEFEAEGDISKLAHHVLTIGPTIADYSVKNGADGFHVKVLETDDMARDIVAELKIELPFRLSQIELESRIKERFFHDIMPKIQDCNIVEATYREPKVEDSWLFEESITNE